MDIVEKAERAIKNLKQYNGQIQLTTSQIRKFLAAVNLLRNKIDIACVEKDTIPEDLAIEVKFLRVNLLYQAGREKSESKGRRDYISDFIYQAGLENMVSQIGNDVKTFNLFCKYVEALVAFHKYYGGKDK